MKRNLSKLNTNELREIAVAAGADRRRLYGTSKQALIVIINGIENTIGSVVTRYSEELEAYYGSYKVLRVATESDWQEIRGTGSYAGLHYVARNLQDGQLYILYSGSIKPAKTH